MSSFNRYKKVPYETWMRQVEAMNIARDEKRIINAQPRDFLMPDEYEEIPRSVIVMDHQTGFILYSDFFKKIRCNSFVLAINGKPSHKSIGFARGMREIAKEVPSYASALQFT